MNSNLGRPDRTPAPANKTPTGTTVDPDAGDYGMDPRAVAPASEGGVQSGIRAAWQDIKQGASKTTGKIEQALKGRHDETFDSPVAVSYPSLPPESVDKLNECIRGEISAMETYELALKSVTHTELTHALRQLRDSHERRVTALRRRLRGMGADQSYTSGAWGALARIVQRGADLFGDKAAMAALEEGEDHGLRLYSEELEGVDPDTREFIQNELLPDQRRTHDLCRSLMRFVKAA
jgi:demethoxyubiquinone hydroxylase (CLK1/Coq7/Cat5 family)